MREGLFRGLGDIQTLSKVFSITLTHDAKAAILIATNGNGYVFRIPYVRAHLLYKGDWDYMTHAGPKTQWFEGGVT